MHPILISSPPGRQPGETCLRVAADLNASAQLGPYSLNLTSLKLADHPEIDVLEAVFDAGGSGSLFYTFDCSRPPSDLLSEFREFARHQLSLHGEPLVRAMGGANGD